MKRKDAKARMLTGKDSNEAVIRESLEQKLPVVISFAMTLGLALRLLMPRTLMVLER